MFCWFFETGVSLCSSGCPGQYADQAGLSGVGVLGLKVCVICSFVRSFILSVSPTSCMSSVHGDQKRASHPLETMDSYKVACGCSKQNMGPLKEQRVLLSTEPCLRSKT